MACIALGPSEPLCSICFLTTAPEPSKPFASQKKFGRIGMLKFEGTIRLLSDAWVWCFKDDANEPLKKSGFASVTPTTSGWRLEKKQIFFMGESFIITPPEGGMRLLLFSSRSVYLSAKLSYSASEHASGFLCSTSLRSCQLVGLGVSLFQYPKYPSSISDCSKFLS